MMVTHSVESKMPELEMPDAKSVGNSVLTHYHHICGCILASGVMTVWVGRGTRKWQKIKK